MSQSHEIKGGATDEAFQEQCFLWERGASVALDFNLLNFEDCLHAQYPVYKEKERKEKTWQVSLSATQIAQSTESRKLC